MKPRSIVFDLFGDHIRRTGGRAPLQALPGLLEREGWFETPRARRQTAYELTPRARTMLDRGRARFKGLSAARLELLTCQTSRLSGRDALRTRIELAHSYGKLPFSDPDLPSRLLSMDWKGRRTHDLFIRSA